MEGVRMCPANLGTEEYILGSHAASVVCEFSCVHKVELGAKTTTEYMRKTGGEKGEVPCGRGPFHVSTEDRYRTWLRDLFEQKSECVFGGEPVALLVSKG